MKKKKHENVENSAAEIAAENVENNVENEKLESIAVFFKDYRRIIQSGPHVYHRNIEAYHRGQIIFNEKLIEELEKEGAPVGVYYRYVSN